MGEDYTSIIYEREPICPFCHNKIKDAEDLLEIGLYQTENMQDGAVWDADCPDCGRKFWFRTHVTYEYDTNTHEDYI